MIKKTNKQMNSVNCTLIYLFIEYSFCTCFVHKLFGKLPMKGLLKNSFSWFICLFIFLYPFVFELFHFNYDIYLSNYCCFSISYAICASFYLQLIFSCSLLYILYKNVVYNFDIICVKYLLDVVREEMIQSKRVNKSVLLSSLHQ